MKNKIDEINKFYFLGIPKIIMENMNLSAIIESITCPITADIMVDPVQGKDGQTYEKAAIIHALSIKQESPITREPMTSADLKVNASIRFLCDKYHQGAFGQASTNAVSPKISINNIVLDHKFQKNSENKTMLSFNINDDSFPKDLESGHLPQDIVLVLDRSGSTAIAVEAKDGDGKNIENGFSILDIVLHAAKTVAKTMDKNSRLAVVKFDDKIETVVNLTKMTEINQSTVLTNISMIKPGGQTNIWGGIMEAIDILSSRHDKSNNGVIIVLTDGSPNISPARGEVETLKRLRKTKNFTAPIYTFGFGYNLQRGLLYDLAKYANGGNGHIPDGGMIATVFCNFLGTILTTVVLNLQLHIQYTEDLNFNNIPPVMGDYPYSQDFIKDNSGRYVIVDIGTVQYGQMRDIIINTDHLTSVFSCYYTYKIGGQSHTSEKININLETLELCDRDVNIHIARYFTVETMRKIINFKTVGSHNDAAIHYDNLVKYYTSKSLTDPLSSGILENIKDQIQIATTNNGYFMKWGEFYMDQLSRSLNQQQKPNFKDPGCPFGGDVFNEIVDKASDIFDTLPPPEASLLQHRARLASSTGYSSPQLPARVSTLAAYNDNSGPCFDSNCIITMENGSTKKLKLLKKGDRVQSVDRDNNLVTASVVCILETVIHGGMCEMVNFDNGLSITPWHPMKHNNNWAFPINVQDSVISSCKSVITLVLDNHHIGFINNTQCIMLGHGFTDDVINHPYYGTQKVIDDMKNMPGWNNGHIVLHDRSLVKEKDENNFVMKLKYNYCNDDIIQKTHYEVFG